MKFEFKRNTFCVFVICSLGDWESGETIQAHILPSCFLPLVVSVFVYGNGIGIGIGDITLSSVLSFFFVVVVILLLFLCFLLPGLDG